MFIITGGGRGLGRSLACALAKHGKTVLIVGRHEASLAEVAAISPNIQYQCVDVSISSERHRLANYLRDTPTIEGLVHNAGIIDPILPIAEITESAWHQCMATNVEAPLFLSQLLIDKLQQGRVLHIGSGAAYFPIKGWATYCVSKAALAMMTRCWQLESQSIAFASVMPGIIDTAMQQTIRETLHMQPEKQDFFRQLKQDNELLSPDTVALFLCWLLLDIDANRFISEEWDIYDKSHHTEWLVPPHVVPLLDK